MEVTQEHSEAQRLILKLIYGPMLAKATHVSVPAVINFSHAVAAVEAALAAQQAELAAVVAERDRYAKALRVVAESADSDGWTSDGHERCTETARQALGEKS